MTLPMCEKARHLPKKSAALSDSREEKRGRTALLFWCRQKNGSSRKVGGSKQGLRRSTKKQHAEGAGERDQLNREKGSRGDFVPFRLPLAGSRDGVPCGVWGNAPTVPRTTSMPNALNKGAGSEVFLPVTLRSRRSAPKLLFPKDSVKNQKIDVRASKGGKAWNSRGQIRLSL